MSFERKLIGSPETYKGRKIEVRFCGPDLLCYVDGADCGQFYMTAEAAKKAGRRYIDECEREKANSTR